MASDNAKAVADGSPENSGEVKLKKELTLFGGVGVIVSIIIGSGIFISPKGVLKDAGSTGLTLSVWALTGILSMIGARCYAELGTTIISSGGDYAYIKKAFGSLPAYLFLWDANIVFVPTTNAIMSLTFSKYVLQPFFPPGCEIPDSSVRIIAAGTIIFLTWLNCYNVGATVKLQNAFLSAKIGGLLLVIIAGGIYMLKGNYAIFDNVWENTQTDPGSIAVCFYSGIFSYAGWNYLNFMTEELKNPYKNLPRAIYISLPLVTIVYVLANVGYLAVLTKTEMLNSDAIGVTFGNKILGSFSWTMPVFVAFSTFGGLSAHIMTSSRLLFVGARDGMFPHALSLISVKRSTPTPALVFLCFLSLCYLCTSDIFALIEYSSFVESSFILLSISGLLKMRHTHPDLPRPIKVPIVLPIVFLFVCAFLVFVPCYVRPMEVGMGVLITITGIPFYFLFVWLKPRPTFFKDVSEELTYMVQKVFVCAKETNQN